MSEDESEQLVRAVTKRIAEIRRAKGFTQAQMAVLLGTAEKNYQRIERGQNLTIHTLGRIAKVLGVRAADFFVEISKRKI